MGVRWKETCQDSPAGFLQFWELQLIFGLPCISFASFSNHKISLNYCMFSGIMTFSCYLAFFVILIVSKLHSLFSPGDHGSLQSCLALRAPNCSLPPCLRTLNWRRGNSINCFCLCWIWLGLLPRVSFFSEAKKLHTKVLKTAALLQLFAAHSCLFTIYLYISIDR